MTDKNTIGYDLSEFPEAAKLAIEVAHNLDLAEMLLKHAPEKADYANDCARRAKSTLCQIVSDNPELKITVTEFIYQLDNMEGFETNKDKVATILSGSPIGLKTAVKLKTETKANTGYWQVENPLRDLNFDSRCGLDKGRCFLHRDGGEFVGWIEFSGVNKDDKPEWSAFTAHAKLCLWDKAKPEAVKWLQDVTGITEIVGGDQVI
jgi:hypothetical protein